ncbi:NUDIX hydrolase [Spirosoma taeanense]|uniref:NUDIX hydrolase n=1 Tax=Spirosoma taeanense TaxID=2735870 RepID=A0A6M5Y870_9BACT|nr:NUDIX domain-containing protein [Spirosoma taeanense]QJW89461.1 NUDIX hydrolase [Spirosoma taeanense]
MEYKERLKQFIQELKTGYLPSVSMDFVIFGFHEGQLKVLLLQWEGIHDWLLPGGRVRLNENLDDAAYRNLRERTGLGEVFLQQFHTFGNVIRNTYYAIEETLDRLGLSPEDLEGLPGRDVSVGYYALVEYTKVKPSPDLLTQEIRWCSIDEVPRLLFDHNEMITLALKTLRRQLSYQPIGYNLLPDKFTMPQLQQLYETILGQPLDRRNFQKRMLGYGILERLEERKAIGAHKAPYLYRFDMASYQNALAEERMFII